MRGLSLIWFLLSMAAACFQGTTHAKDFPRITIIAPEEINGFDLLVSALSNDNAISLVNRSLLSEDFFEQALSEARSGLVILPNNQGLWFPSYSDLPPL